MVAPQLPAQSQSAAGQVALVVGPAQRCSLCNQTNWPRRPPDTTDNHLGATAPKRKLARNRRAQSGREYQTTSHRSPGCPVSAMCNCVEQLWSQGHLNHVVGMGAWVHLEHWWSVSRPYCGAQYLGRAVAPSPPALRLRPLSGRSGARNPGDRCGHVRRSLLGRQLGP